MKRYTAIVLLLLFLSSCSPQKRLQRLLKKNPQLIELDTIRVIDTVIIQRYDTTLINTIIRQDSVTLINTERIKIKYYYDTITEKIEHFISLPSDTITQEVIIPYEKIVYKELSWWEQYKTIILILSLLTGVLIVLKKLGKLI